MSILLSTLNARYAHTALGLRYLKANMGALQSRTELMEFVIGADVTVLAEKILSRKPRILGLSVYIWNVEETTKLVSLIKAVFPIPSLFSAALKFPMKRKTSLSSEWLIMSSGAGVK